MGEPTTYVSYDHTLVTCLSSALCVGFVPTTCLMTFAEMLQLGTVFASGFVIWS